MSHAGLEDKRPLSGRDPYREMVFVRSPSEASILRAEWWAEKDSNLRRRKPADLQSALVDHLSIDPQ